MTAQFLTRFQVEQVGPDLWMLLADLTFYSEQFRGSVTVKAGYTTDFASVPKIFASITPKYGGFNQAAVIHDAALTNDCWADTGERQTWTRGYANDLFSEGLKACGVSWWRRQLMVAAVRLFASKDELVPTGKAEQL